MNDIELNFGAITIDNATLKSEGYKFYEGLLAQMHQFKDSPVKVVQTDIVHNEAVKHIGEEISKARSTIDQALRSANKQLKIHTNVIEQAKALLSVDGDEHSIADKRLHMYYEHINAEIVYAEKYADLSVLMKLYFGTRPPFESGKDKKNEFPDAIALLSLEGWAEENELNVIAVSQDKGWKNYSEHSERITVVPSLSEALEKFQPHNKVASIIAHIREDSLLDEENHVLEKIKQAIINSIDGYDIWIEANSYLHFDWDDVSATYLHHTLDTDENGLVRIRIVRIDDQSIILKVGAYVEVEVEANFSFSIRDSIDKDYVGLGGALYKINEDYHTDILMTLAGDFSQDFDNLDVTDIEVLETIKQADFGDIAPDYSNDYDDDELY